MLDVFRSSFLFIIVFDSIYQLSPITPAPSTEDITQFPCELNYGIQRIRICDMYVRSFLLLRHPALPCTGELSCNTDTKTLVLWDYLISIGDEVGTDSPLPCATDKPLDRLDLGKFQFHYFFLP